MVEVGDKFIGSVDGMVFKITEFRAERTDVGLKPDYTLSYGTSKTVHVTESLLGWLIKSGGLVQQY